jgi:anti-sigma28 factor (negative regulator of flagellin synthesis)
MRINDASPPLQQPNSQPINERNNHKKTDQDPGIRQRSDSVEISADAKRLFSGEKVTSSESTKTSNPEAVRPQGSSLDTVEIGHSTSRLAKALTNAGIFTDADEAQKVASKILEKMTSVPSSEDNKLETVRKRIDSGFYGSRQVAEKVADKLLKEMTDIS